MKRCLWFIVLLVAIPAFASEIGMSSSGGTLSVSGAGLSVAGSLLDEFGGTIGNLGTLSLTTGNLLSGNLAMGAIFAAGGTFTITGNGMDGVHNGVIFSGTFGQLTWQLLTAANGTHSYDLLGSFSGTWFTGQKVTGAFTVLTHNAAEGFFDADDRITVASADVSAQIAPVPEPGTLGLLGTGLGLLGGLTRRLKRS